MVFCLQLKKEDINQFIKKCEACQKNANLVHAPANNLIPIESPWPLSLWSFDLIGKINPPYSDGHKLIITATYHCTKWV